MTAIDTRDAALVAIDRAIQVKLAPLAARIDTEALYPGAFLRELGRLGGFGAAAGEAPAFDLARSIDVGSRVGRVCGSTAFLVWCQSTCVWYLRHAPEAAVRERYLAPVAHGELLAGSAMSNALKHLDGIEKLRLTARREGDGYVVDGVLPWVSNMGEGHLAIAAAEVPDEGYVMFLVEDGAQGFGQNDCPEFAGMAGTATLNLKFKHVVVGAGQVLAHPAQFEAYMARIKPGLVLNQAGLGFGVIEGAIDSIREANASHAEVNGYLDDLEAELRAALATLQASAAALVAAAEAGPSPVLPVLKARAAISELALRAANSAVLHAGAKGYLLRSPVQRRLREAVFVGIVSPALKHLRKAINDQEHAAAAA